MTATEKLRKQVHEAKKQLSKSAPASKVSMQEHTHCQPFTMPLLRNSLIPRMMFNYCAYFAAEKETKGKQVTKITGKISSDMKQGNWNSSSKQSIIPNMMLIIL